MSIPRYISLEKLGPRQFTNFDTLQDIVEYDSVKLSDDSEHIVSSYTFDHTHPDFIKECDLIHKRRQTRYDYTSDGLQCTVSIEKPSKRYLAKTSGETQEGLMKEMPTEIVVNILNFSKIDDIKNLAAVSKRFATIVQVELQRNILVREHVEDNGKFVGDGIFANQTLVSYKKFKENVIFLKKNFVKSIHFEDPRKFLMSSYYRSLIKLLPHTEMLVSDSKNNPISVNPKMAHLHPQFNGATLLKEQGSSSITKISIDTNYIPGEILFQYLRKFPSLEFIEIDSFKMNNPLVISEAEKLRLKFLHISGDTYNDIFEVVQPDYLKCIYIEQKDLNGNDLNGSFWSRLDFLESLSLGYTNDKLIHSLSTIPSEVIKRFTLIFREPIAEVTMFERVLLFKEALSITLVHFDKCSNLDYDNGPYFMSERFRLQKSYYLFENFKCIYDCTDLMQFLENDSLPVSQVPFIYNEPILSVFYDELIRNRREFQ